MMKTLTAEEILAKFENIALTHEEIVSAMQKYATQQLAEKDKEIESLKKQIHPDTEAGGVVFCGGCGKSK